MVPTFVLQGQRNEMIPGTNVIKYILHQYRQCDAYWKTVSAPCPAGDPESEQFLSMLAGLDCWRGEEVPFQIVTVRSNLAVCLEPGREYLMCGSPVLFPYLIIEAVCSRSNAVNMYTTA